ncbi:formyltransferase family protein [Azospirillum sp. SYSU D00513]|uniref:formyltransferase family protein n=1 Tax=Azospirillum sp. SYSU D00513 TaxID=2812561 RepID=UPI001A97A7B8|nr:formyltransferase family protein [Azospirillum sp. SYSU D00513]
MRILLCSKRDFTSVIVLNDLLARCSTLPGCRFGLMLAERTRATETSIPELTQMKLFERDLPFGILFPLIDEAREGGGKAGAAELRTLNGLIAHHRVPTMTISSLKAPETLAAIDAFRPDLILSVRFSFIFRPALIARPPLGIVNIHPGRLPDFAGLYPHFHSIMVGEPTLGCTVHRIVDDGIDTGPILAEGAVPIDPRRSAFSHNLDSHLLGNRLAVEVLAALSRGERLDGTPQDPSRRRYHSYPTPEEFDRFRQAGRSLIQAGEYIAQLRRFGTPATFTDDFPFLFPPTAISGPNPLHSEQG